MGAFLEFAKEWGVGHAISTLSLLLSLIFVSFVLRSKNPPGSTAAWLLFIVVVPYLGIPLYIFLSQRKFVSFFNKKKPIHEAPRPRGGGANAVEQMLNSLGVAPARHAEHLQIIDSGSAALGAILEILESAEKTIHVTTFIFASDDVGDKIVEVLERKARLGVKVRILVDSFGSLWIKHPSFAALEKSGGQIAYFMPFFHLPFKGRSNLRNHRKMLIVDSTRAVMGGMNIAHDYMGPQHDHWIDLAIQLRGDAVADIEAIFAQDWEFATREKIPAVFLPQAAITATGQVQIIASGPDVKGDPLYDFLLTLLFSAKSRIWIATPYFIPDESLATALELAVRRGVDVRIWVPKKSNHALADLARASYLHDLFDAGASIQYVSRMMHGKAVLVDHLYGIVGSANFDMRSLMLNYEVGAVLFPKSIIESLERWFKEMPVKELESWPASNYFVGLLEGAGRVVGPLI